MDLVQEIVADKAAGTRRLVAEYGNRLYETAIRLCGTDVTVHAVRCRPSPVTLTLEVV